jgi:hypothetical protein
MRGDSRAATVQSYPNGRPLPMMFSMHQSKMSTRSDQVESIFARSDVVNQSSREATCKQNAFVQAAFSEGRYSDDATSRWRDPWKK